MLNVLVRYKLYTKWVLPFTLAYEMAKLKFQGKNKARALKSRATSGIKTDWDKAYGKAAPSFSTCLNKVKLMLEINPGLADRPHQLPKKIGCCERG